MNKKKNQKKKIIIACILLQTILLAFEPFIVNAFFFGGGGDTSNVVRDGINTFLEEDLNINVEDSLRPMTEGINTVDRKGVTPEVSIRFSTPNPKEGEKITASADVSGLANIGDAYYIWYLRNPNRPEDLIFEHIAEEMWVDRDHIKAIRAQAELYFDPETLDQATNGGDQDGNFYEEYDRYDGSEDDDGFKAPMGGGNQRDGASNYCYVYDVATGEQFEMAEPGDTSSGCPSGYVARCMQGDKSIQCPTLVEGASGEATTTATADADSGDGTSNTSADTNVNITGLGGSRFRNLWRCVDVGITPTCIDGELSCPTADGDWGKNYKYGRETSGNDEPTPFCVPKNSETGQVWTDPNAPSGGCPAAKMSWCFDGEIWPEDEELYETMCGLPYGELRDNYYSAGCRGWAIAEVIKKPESCEIEETKDNTCDDDIRRIPPGSGDGSFGIAEEKLYHLNPLTDKTTPHALNDEALVVGLGVKDFTWKYQEGDEIGVIVEGIGNEATKHENATYQTVFALMKPACKDVLQDDGSYMEEVKSKQLEIKVGYLQDIEDTQAVGLNACISINNLYTKPGTSEYDALDVTVSSGGSSGGSNTQAAIPSGLGIEKTITATAGQTQGGSISQPSDLYYEWDVQCRGESIKNDEDFKDNITSKTKGTNLKNLTLITDFPNGKDEDGNENGSTNCFDENGQGEITITAKINEPRSGGGSNFGQSTTTLSVYDIEDNPLKVYKTEIVDETKYQATSAMLCDEGIDKTVCRVMDNEVIAIKAEEFTSGTDVEDGMISWLVDGREYTCDESISSDCSNESNTDTIIIPFTGSDGDFVSVTANMSNISNEKNQKQQVTRVFRITEPSVMITPQGNTVNRKVLGVYTDLDDDTYEDESETDFEIEEGETAVFSAMLYPEFLNTNTDGITYEWYIDGELYDTEKTIYYVPDSDTSISVKVKRELSLDERLALEEGLGITQSQTIPETFNQTIQLNVKENTTVAKGVGGFFATAQHNAPEYILFLLKITFAICIMLFVPSLVLGMGRE